MGVNIWPSTGLAPSALQFFSLTTFDHQDLLPTCAARPERSSLWFRGTVGTRGAVGLADATRCKETQVAPQLPRLPCESEPSVRSRGVSEAPPPRAVGRARADCSTSAPGLGITLLVWGFDFFSFFKKFYLFIYLFIYGCVGSSFLCKGFL